MTMMRSNMRLWTWILAAALGCGALQVQAAPSGGSSKKSKSDKDAKKAPERPGSKAASTSGLAAALKKTETVDTRQGPAKFDTAARAVARDAKADKLRDAKIVDIQKQLPRTRSPELQADLRFRLAEAWWDKSQYVKLSEEMPSFQQSADKWNECVREKGEKGCGPEPRPDNRKSESYRKEAVDLYKQIVKDFPKYERADEVQFILAYNMTELAGGLEGKAREQKMSDAVKQFQQLIQIHPKSRFVSDAYTQLGNHYFEGNQLAPARKAFEECSKLHIDKTETYCIYKLAWCDINSGDYAAAERRFKDVIARSEATKENDKVRLKNEALRDIIKPLVELKQLDGAITYFRDHAGDKGARQYIQALASTYFSAGNYDMAVKAYRRMLVDMKDDANAPEWQSKIVLAYDKLNQRSKVLEEMRGLVNNYRPGSEWAQTNASNKAAIEIALSLTEEALYNLVTDYHQEAIKTKSVPTYRLARDIYAEYVENFPESERAYQMRFYYGEILFSLEEYQKAYEQYVKVAVSKEREDLRPVAARNSLIAAENLVKIDNGQMKLSIDQGDNAGKKIDETKDKGQVQQSKIAVKIDKAAKEIELTPMEKQLVEACDRYVELVPSAEDEATVRLRAAVMYFDKARYVESAHRFDYIINKWPDNKTSATAAQLTLEALEVKEQWAPLNELARKFAQNQKLLAGKEKDEFRKKLAVYVEGSAFKIASEVNDKDKDFPKAARMFRDFVAEFPKSKYAPIGLAKAFYIYQDAKQLDTAIQVGEQFVAEYKDADSNDMRQLPGAEAGQLRPLIVPDLRFKLAKLYESLADFAVAAAQYEKFAADFASDDRSPDAQFNAALWFKGLGETDKAIAAFERYIKMYEGRKPDDRKRLNLPADAAVFFEICTIIEGTKDWNRLVGKLDEYLRKYPSEEGWKKVNAQYKRFLVLKELGRSKNVDDTADTILSLARGLSEEDRGRPSSRLAIAHARFHKLEPRFQDYTRIKFNSPNTLPGDLKRKTSALEELKREYLEIVRDSAADPEYAIAALVRLAVLPKLFGRSLLDAPMPKGLDEEQQELYRATLEEKALEYEEPAITGLETALQKAFEFGIYNEWTLEAERLLGEFKPDLFGEVHELPLRGTEFFFVGALPGAASEGK